MSFLDIRCGRGVQARASPKVAWARVLELHRTSTNAHRCSGYLTATRLEVAKSGRPDLVSQVDSDRQGATTLIGQAAPRHFDFFTPRYEMVTADGQTTEMVRPAALLHGEYARPGSA
jgi:hypothetical protein